MQRHKFNTSGVQKPSTSRATMLLKLDAVGETKALWESGIMRTAHTVSTYQSLISLAIPSLNR
jgi:hypothetical protein